MKCFLMKWKNHKWVVVLLWLPPEKLIIQSSSRSIVWENNENALFAERKNNNTKGSMKLRRKSKWKRQKSANLVETLQNCLFLLETIKKWLMFRIFASCLKDHSEKITRKAKMETVHVLEPRESTQIVEKFISPGNKIGPVSSRKYLVKSFQLEISSEKMIDQR